MTDESQSYRGSVVLLRSVEYLLCCHDSTRISPHRCCHKGHTRQCTCTRTHAVSYWNISAGISLDDDTHEACWYSMDEPSRHSNPVLPWQQRKCCARAGGMGRRGARWQFVKVNSVLPFPFQSIRTALDLGLVPRVMMKDEIKNFFFLCVWKLEDKGWHDRPVFPERDGGPKRLKQRTPGIWLQ